MKTITWLALPALAGCALTLSACKQDVPAASSTETTDVSSTADMAASSSSDAVVDAATYVAKAGAGDLFEIESSRAILKTTKNAQVKDFAEMMIKAHEESTAKVKAAAKAADLKVDPPKLSAEMTLKLAAIKAAPAGETADKLYLGAQRQGHKDALALHQGYAAGGDTPALKAAAAEIAPIVEQHIAMLDKIG